MSIDDKRKDKNPFGRSISASPGLPALAIQKSLHRRLHRVLSTRIGSPNDKVHLSFIFNFLFWNLLNLKIASYYVRPIKVKLRFRGSPYVLNVFSVTTICKTKSKYAESSRPNHLHVVPRHYHGLILYLCVNLLLRQLTISFPIQCNLD